MIRHPVDAVLDALISVKTALRVALVFVAQYCILRGVGYTPWFSPERLPEGVATISFFVPLPVFTGLWFAAGILALCCIPGVHPEGSAGAAFMALVWAVGYTTSWVSSLDGITLRWFSYHLLPYINNWQVPLPCPWLLVDGSPANRDYLTASQYWFAIGLLGCGYVLARWALARGESGRAAAA